MTILHKAAEKRLTAVAQKLLSREELPLVNARDTHKSTALHYAAWQGDIDTCCSILRHKCFIAIKALDSVGKSALHCAAEKGYCEVCQQILLHMDIVGTILEERKGRTAAQLARNGGHVEVERVINDHILVQSEGAFRNDTGHVVALGYAEGVYYCGRRLGRHLISGRSDGQCGPNNGPQYDSCRAFQSHSPQLVNIVPGGADAIDNLPPCVASLPDGWYKISSGKWHGALFCSDKGRVGMDENDRENGDGKYRWYLRQGPPGMYVIENGKQLGGALYCTNESAFDHSTDVSIHYSTTAGVRDDNRSSWTIIKHGACFRLTSSLHQRGALFTSSKKEVWCHGEKIHPVGLSITDKEYIYGEDKLYRKWR